MPRWRRVIAPDCKSGGRGLESHPGLQFYRQTMEIFKGWSQEDKINWLKKKIQEDPDEGEIGCGMPINTPEDAEAFGKYLREFVKSGKRITNDEQHEAALKRINELMGAKEGTAEGIELELLSEVVEEYEKGIFDVK